MKVLLGEDELRAGVVRLADEVRAVYGDRPLTVLGVLTGSLVLLADLIRCLELPLRVGVLQARSYRGTVRGELTIDAALTLDIAGRDVLLVDDIFDSGHTLSAVAERVRELQPGSLRTAVLLVKRTPRSLAFRPDFYVFEIPDEFVVGYGLDYRDHYRNLPYVAALEEADLRDVPQAAAAREEA